MIKHTWFNKFFTFLKNDHRSKNYEYLSSKFQLNFCILFDSNDCDDKELIDLIANRDENSKFDELIKYDALGSKFVYCILLQYKENIYIYSLNYEERVYINLEKESM